MGLRGRLLGTTLAVVVAAFAVVWWIARDTARGALLHLSEANLGNSAQNLARAVRETLADARADAITAARLDLAAEAIDTGDAKNFRWYADALVRTKPKYAAIVVADAQGTIVGANTRGRGGALVRPGLERRRIEETWAREALAGSRDQPVWIPPSRPGFLRGALAPDEQVVGYSLPVLDILDERIGTVTVLVTLEQVAATLTGYVSRTDGRVDAFAILVDDRDGAPIVLPTGLRDRTWRAVRLQGPGGEAWRRAGGEEFHWAATPVGRDGPLARWRIAQLRRVASFEADVATMSSTLLVTFAVAVILAIIVLVLTATRFLAPVRRLTRAIQGTDRASTFAELPVETTDEVGTLTASFNRAFATIREYERSLEVKVADRTRDLAAAKQEVADILDNMSEGIFTIDPRGLVNPQFSAACRTIFGPRPVAGERALELLEVTATGTGQEAHARTSFWLENIFGADELQWALASADPVASTVYHSPPDGPGEPLVKHLRLEYAPIYKESVVAKVMVIAKDVTDVTRLEAKVELGERRNRENLERVAEIAHLDPELFETFLAESRDILAACEERIGTLGADGGAAPTRVNELFRLAHTLKGNARIFKIATVQNCAHELEDTLASIRDGDGSLEPDMLARLRGHVARLRELFLDLERLGERVLLAAGEPRRAGAVVRIAAARIVELRRAYKEFTRATAAGGLPLGVREHSEQLARAVQGLTLVPIGDVLDRMRKMVLDLAREAGKTIDDLLVEGGDVLVDTKLADRLRDVLVHALRNAVDHGIEQPDERPSRKPARGRVSVRCAWHGADLVIDVDDDGRGIDLSVVRARGVALRLFDDEHAALLRDDELFELLFRPGFSTATKVTELSGRGVGLDVIRTTICELRGHVSLRSRLGDGTTVTLRIPGDYYQQL